MKSLLYATTNDYKLLAANMALQDYDLTLEKLSKDIIDIAEVQSESQEEVALDKANKYFEILNRPLVVMDFGFFLEGYNGFPGVYTKYAIDTIGVDGLIHLARNVEDRRAYTQSTIVYKDNLTSKSFSFRCPGTILLEKKGTNGRDYDMVFHVDEVGKTLAEMTEAQKAVLRGGAWRELGEWLHGRSL